jgi:hypothetical protein
MSVVPCAHIGHERCVEAAAQRLPPDFITGSPPDQSVPYPLDGDSLLRAIQMYAGGTRQYGKLLQFKQWLEREAADNPNFVRAIK